MDLWKKVQVCAPFSGVVAHINTTEGSAVTKGTTLIILNAMKMEHEIAAPCNGTLTKLLVGRDSKVLKGHLLAVINPIPNEGSAAQQGVSPAVRRVSTLQQQLQPDTWKLELDELRHRQQLAYRLGGDEGVARQRAAGKLTVRERIALLLDPNSFEEIGSIAGKATYVEDGTTISAFTPANFISGRGEIDRRPVIVGGDDFTVRGGHADGGIFRKQGYAEQLARTYRIPMVRLIDGSSGGGSVATILNMQATYVPPLYGFEHQVAMLDEVPVAAALLGPTVGLGAARAVTSHFSVMVRGVSQLFVAGPPVVEYATHEKLTKEELGGVAVCGGNGSIDNIADTEAEAFQHVRRFLGYLPSNVWELSPRRTNRDDPERREEELLSIIPKQRNTTYDIRRLIALVVDKDSFFEIGRSWGQTIVGFARLDGYAVGIISSDCEVLGGVMSAQGSDKLRRHVDLCNTFHVPVVAFVDQPGFAVGLEAEKEGTIRHGASAIAAMYQATVPWFSVIVRRVFGVAGGAWTDRGDPDMRVAWPSGEWGSLPLEGGIEAAFKRTLENAENPQEMRAQMLERFDRVRSPFRTAEQFGIEEIIDPRDTRPRLCRWVALMYRTLAHSGSLGPKAGRYRP